MPTLRDLDGQFLRLTPDSDRWAHVATLAEADGVMFLCPKCFAANGGPVGTHRIICWFPGKVPDDLDPKPGRWPPSGSGLDDLTLTGSVKLTGGCQWHGSVSGGRAA